MRPGWLAWAAFIFDPFSRFIYTTSSRTKFTENVGLCSAPSTWQTDPNFALYSPVSGAVTSISDEKPLATTDYSLAHSLPANVEAERSILGAILLDNFSYNQAAEHLKPEDFSLDSHRRIYSRMMDLAESSRPIDMITLVEEFDRHKELQAIGDVGYISGLVDGVPDRPSIEHYIKIVRDKALLRGLIHASNSAIARASDQSDPAEEVLNDAEAAIMQLSEKRIGRGFMGVQDIVKESFGSVDALLQRGQRITGLATHYTDLDEMTSGLQRADLIIIAARPSMGKTAFAMNIAENASIEDQKVVGMFSLEMSREALLLRLLCSKAGWTRTRCAPARCGAMTWTKWCMPWSNWHMRPSLSMTRRASASAKCAPRRGG